MLGEFSNWYQILLLYFQAAVVAFAVPHLVSMAIYWKIGLRFWGGALLVALAAIGGILSMVLAGIAIDIFASFFWAPWFDLSDAQYRHYGLPVFLWACLPLGMGATVFGALKGGREWRQLRNRERALKGSAARADVEPD